MTGNRLLRYWPPRSPETHPIRVQRQPHGPGKPEDPPPAQSQPESSTPDLLLRSARSPFHLPRTLPTSPVLSPGPVQSQDKSRARYPPRIQHKDDTRRGLWDLSGWSPIGCPTFRPLRSRPPARSGINGCLPPCPGLRYGPAL